MNVSLALLSGSGIFYGAALLFHLASFFGKSTRGPAFALMRVGFLLSTFYFISQAVDYGVFLPVASFSQAMAFFAWCLAFVYLVLLVQIQTESFGLVLTPILFALTAGALLSFSPGGPAPAQASSIPMNPYFKVHIITAFFAYACFALSFSGSFLYLIQHHELKAKRAGTFYHRLPSLEELERLVYQPLWWGVPLLLAATGVGFLWSKTSFGAYGLLDPKTIATGLTLLLYLSILFIRHFSSLGGKRAAVLSVIAFGLVLFSFVGTRFLHGSHPYLE